MIAVIWVLLFISTAMASDATDWTIVDLNNPVSAPASVAQEEQFLLPTRPYLYGSIEESCSPENIKILACGIISGSLMVGAGVLYYYLNL